MDLLRPTYVHIHLDRLIENFRFLSRAPFSHDFLCPMIKANAYGHGDVSVAKALESVGCQYFGVASVEEGLHLKKHHISAKVLVFGFHGTAALAPMLENQLIPVVSNFEQLENLTARAKSPQKIHLKFDTGMHRLGFQLSDLEAVLKKLADQPFIQVEGVCTHLHSGDNILEPNESSSYQLQVFEKITQAFPKSLVFHAYNSAAMASLHGSNQKFLYGSRPGLLVYGIDPSDNLKLTPLISPVMEFKSKIVATQRVKSGDVVSYGGTWKAPKDSLIGIVPAGYADGVCRSLSNQGEFLVSGQRVPIRGRVCMDYTMVDLTDVSPSSQNLCNQEVVLWGEQQGDEIPLAEVSKNCGWVNYEILTGISERVPRFYGAKK